MVLYLGLRSHLANLIRMSTYLGYALIGLIVSTPVFSHIDFPSLHLKIGTVFILPSLWIFSFYWFVFLFSFFFTLMQLKCETALFYCVRAVKKKICYCFNRINICSRFFVSHNIKVISSWSDFHDKLLSVSLHISRLCLENFRFYYNIFENSIFVSSCYLRPQG